MEVISRHRTADELEALVGEQVRATRIARSLNQAGLARLADISVGALSNLERGRGSSLRTVVVVVRALGRTDWLDALAPAVDVSPLHMLRAGRRSQRTRLRVKKSQPSPEIGQGR